MVDTCTVIEHRWILEVLEELARYSALHRLSSLEAAIAAASEAAHKDLARDAVTPEPRLPASAIIVRFPSKPTPLAGGADHFRQPRPTPDAGILRPFLVRPRGSGPSSAQRRPPRH